MSITPRYDSPMRLRLMESAMRLLATEGPSGMSTRKIAAAAGTSTMSLYAQFGSMPDLVNALVDDRFARLREQLEAGPRTDDPIADLGRIFAAHIAHARANPELYEVMFGSSPLAGYQRADDDFVRAGRCTLDYIVDVVRRAVDAHRLEDLDPTAIATQIWTTLHGYVVLELAGYFAEPETGLHLVLQPLMLNLIVGLGDSKDAATDSSSSWFESS